MYSTNLNIIDKQIKTNENSITNKYITYPDKTSKRQSEGGLRLQNKYKHSIENKPLVTIITVVYNAEKLLERCILSVLNQTYDNIEYIIIDGCSTDSTLDIIKKYEDYIDYFISEPDDGIYYAMNKGLELASGDYIAILNSDDWYYKHGLSTIFNNEHNKDVIIAIIKIFDPTQGKVIDTVFPKKINESIYLTSVPNHQAILFAKNIYNKVGFFNTDYTIVADWDMFLRAYKLFSSSVMQLSYNLLTYFSTGGISSSPTQEIYEKHIGERKNIFKSYFPELDNKDLEILQVAYWQDLATIQKYFSTQPKNKYSKEFINVLNEFALSKSEQPYIEKENLTISFLDTNNKASMIEKLKSLMPLDITDYDKNSNIVVLSSDRNYEPHLWVTISSMIDSSSNKINYSIYILDGGITYKENFYNLISKKNNFKITFINMKDQFLVASESKHLTKAAYYRLAIFYLFSNYDKIVYIDADSYILSDVDELFNIDMENKTIAGSKDSITWQKCFLEEIITINGFTGLWIDYERKYLNHGKKRVDSYINSGVLIFNFKNTDIKEKQKKLSELLKYDYYSHDQDIINLMYDEDEIYILGREWNYFNVSTTLNKTDYLNEDEKENYYNMKICPKIVSYILKPWTYEFCQIEYYELYWNKISNSPYLHEVELKLEIDKLKNKTQQQQQNKNKLTFIEHIFSVYTRERFVEIMIFGIKISIKRKNN